MGLLDINVLIALAWPNHVHHTVAQAWFARHRGSGWATCSITESGFVRVSANRSVIPSAVSPTEARLLLRRLRALEGHEFLVDDVSIAVAEVVDTMRLVGHRQVTDAHLIALASRHQVCLVTLDRRLSDLLPEDRREVLTCLLPTDHGGLKES